MAEVRIGPLLENDLKAASRIVRLAFGTFLGTLGPEPPAETDGPSDADHVWTRWRADPRAAFAAHIDGKLVGSNLATHWGSVGFFGPLTVHPDYWDQGIGRRLLEPVLALFDTWKVTHAGLFTFAQSPKHLHLYQHFGFWPRFLTAIMVKRVTPAAPSREWSRLSALAEP